MCVCVCVEGFFYFVSFFFWGIWGFNYDALGNAAPGGKPRRTLEPIRSPTHPPPTPSQAPKKEKCAGNPPKIKERNKGRKGGRVGVGGGVG